MFYQMNIYIISLQADAVFEIRMKGSWKSLLGP